jgi:hypothetical protein
MSRLARAARDGDPLRMSPQEALAYVEHHGVVLASARGPLPSVAEAVAGEPVAGRWWSHPRAHAIFAALSAVHDDPDVLACRLVRGKLTFVHRRLWPALARMAPSLDPKRVAAVREEHTASGRHRAVETPFPEWVPPDVAEAAAALDEAEARRLLGV